MAKGINTERNEEFGGIMQSVIEMINVISGREGLIIKIMSRAKMLMSKIQVDVIK